MLGALYLFSGALGLAYEVLWSRLLAYQFGASIFGVATTVAAFMTGLGLGSIWVSCSNHPLLQSVRATPARALQAFAALEGAIGLYALALPPLQSFLAQRLDPLCAILPPQAWYALQAGLAFLLLTVPACAMGAGFPIVLRAAPHQPHLLSRFYGLNCLGAALGALGVVQLMADAGWERALQVCATASGVVALSAVVMSRRQRRVADIATTASVPPAGRPGNRLWRAALVYALVGAAALMLEIAWTRLFGLILLRTEYVLAVILAVYLLGTAAGSLLAPTVTRHPSWKPVVPWMAGIGALLGMAFAPTLAQFVQAANPASLTQALLLDSGCLVLLLAPCTFALGAWLPLLAGQSSHANHQPSSGAILYGSNALGAALGAIVTVSWGLPVLGTYGCMVGAASALLLLGTSLIPVGKARTVHLVMAGLVAVTATSLWHRMPPAQRLLATDPPPGIEIDRYEDALTLNQVMQGADGQRVLLTDLQHMDAATDPASVQIQQDQVRLPLVLHPHPRTLLLLGLGTGISASAAHELPDLHIEAADISPGAIRAAQTWFAPVNHRIMDRVVAHADDARHFLGSSQAQYDIIVGDLFHPDLAGMSSLLSVEQFARARAHLSDGGVFIQWVALNQFDQDSLFTVLRSFRVVFPQGVLFLDGMHLALAGSVGVVPEQLMAEALRRGDRTPLPNGTDDTVTWMGRYLGPIPATTGPTENERRPHIEYRLAHLHYTSEPPIAPLLARLRQQRPGADNTANRLGLTGEQRNAFVSAHAATSMAMQSWEAALAGRAEQALTLVHLAHEANPHDHWMASALADERFEQWQTSGTAPDPRQLQNILDIFPEHLDARRTLWHWLREAGQTTAAAQQAERLRQLAPLDPEFANLAPITSKAVNPGVVSGP